MNGPALGVLCVIMVIAIPIGLLIGALILRGGVWLANKCLPQPGRRYYDEDDDYDDDWDDDYDRPRIRRGRRGGRTAIPEPPLGKAMGVVFVRFIIGFIVSIPISLALRGVAGGRPDASAQIVASLIQLPIGFLINAGVLTPMLPTTFPRACLVVLFEYLIALAIGLVIAVPLIALAFAVGGR